MTAAAVDLRREAAVGHFGSREISNNSASSVASSPPAEVPLLLRMASVSAHSTGSVQRQQQPPPHLGHLHSYHHQQQQLQLPPPQQPRPFKLIVLGDEFSGKSSLIHTLLRGPGPDALQDAPDRTFGIEISEWEANAEDVRESADPTIVASRVEPHLCGKDEDLFTRFRKGKGHDARPFEDILRDPSFRATRPISFSISDFAGQRVYRGTHQFFLSRHALYLLTWDTSEPRNRTEAGMEDQVFHFLYSIQARVPGATILLVLTKADAVHEDPAVAAELMQKYHAKLMRRFKKLEKKRIKEIKATCEKLEAEGRSASASADAEYNRLLSLCEPQHRPKLLTQALIVSALTGLGIDALKTRMVQLASCGKIFPHSHPRVEIPPSYKVVADIVMEKRQEGLRWIEWPKLVQLVKHRAAEHVIVTEHRIMAALQWMHDVGDVVYNVGSGQLFDASAVVLDGREATMMTTATSLEGSDATSGVQRREPRRGQLRTTASGTPFLVLGRCLACRAAQDCGEPRPDKHTLENSSRNSTVERGTSARGAPRAQEQGGASPAPAFRSLEPGISCARPGWGGAPSRRGYCDRVEHTCLLTGR